MSERELRYVNDDMPGITRRRRGRGFSYHTPQGELIVDKNEKERIKNLVIPPAWMDVWICPLVNGHLQATGRDLKRRKQYRYHDLWEVIRNQSKFNRMLIFGKSLPKIRKCVEKDLAKEGLKREKVIAVVISLLDRTLMRIGNEQYSKNNNSYGLTTLKNKHLQVNGKTVEFSYPAKGGIKRNVKISDRKVANIIKKCHEISGYRIFQCMDNDQNVSSIDSEDVNAYLKQVTDHDFTSKDFRTWGATIAAFHYLKELDNNGSAKDKDKKIVEAVKKAAKKLGNKPATCRKYYIHPAVLEAYSDGNLHRSSVRKRKGLSPEEAEVLNIIEKSEET